MSKTISQFSEKALYVDTMIFYLLLREKGSAAEALFQRIQNGEMQAYTSVLTFDELAYRLLLARVRDTYGGSPLDHLRKNEQKLIAEFSPEIELAFTQLQSFSNLTLLEFTRTDLIAMHKNMRRHHLRPRDALHLAAMQKVECSNLVSQDSDFERVPGIQHYTLT